MSHPESPRARPTSHLHWIADGSFKAEECPNRWGVTMAGTNKYLLAAVERSHN